MTAARNIAPRSPETFPDWRFDHLDIEYDEESSSVWMNYKVDSPNCYTLPMLLDAIEFERLLRQLFASPSIERWPIRYFVMASKKPDVFSLGGDLATFASAVRTRNREGLLTYAHRCIDVMYGLTSAFDLPIVTLSAVRGQCMGGGFEGALATDFMIAEESAKLGVPEVAFNTFPGMGAITFLKRRVGEALAEQIISNGSVQSARDLYALGIVDVLAQEHSLRETTISWMLYGGEERWLRRKKLANYRRRCFPIKKKELVDIVELWTDCCFQISEPDLRHMERLVAAQARLTKAARNRTNSNSASDPVELRRTGG
jgi:DSF synthase